MIPQPGDRYQHFKGTVYTIVGIAKPPTAQNQGLPKFVATHTETGQLLLIWQQDESFSTADDGPSETLVLYWDLEVSEKLWARPLDNFLAVLSSGADDRASNYHRFTKVGGSDE